MINQYGAQPIWYRELINLLVEAGLKDKFIKGGIVFNEIRKISPNEKLLKFLVRASLNKGSAIISLTILNIIRKKHRGIYPDLFVGHSDKMMKYFKSGLTDLRNAALEYCVSEADNIGEFLFVNHTRFKPTVEYFRLIKKYGDLRLLEYLLSFHNEKTIFDIGGMGVKQRFLLRDYALSAVEAIIKHREFWKKDKCEEIGGAKVYYRDWANVMKYLDRKKYLVKIQ